MYTPPPVDKEARVKADASTRRVEALSRTIGRLRKRVDEQGARIAALEAKLNG